MASFNLVIVIGNLTRDPELKAVGNSQLCRFSVAVNRQFKNRQTGALVQEVCYIDVDVWGAIADSCQQYLQKGKQVLIEGRLKFDSWKDTDGKTRSKHSITADKVVFLGERQNSDSVMGDQLDSEMPATVVKAAKAAKGAVRASDPAPVIFEDEPPFDENPF